jgi:predicted aspartyl protease
MAALAAFSVSTALAGGRCQLLKIGEMPVDMQGLRPLVSTRINGTTARFLLDTGSFYSLIWHDAAVQYHLRISSYPGEPLYIAGFGGSQEARIATVKSFEFLGTPLPKVQFLVVSGSSAGESVGLLGENLLHISDEEYDFANGIVRFFKPVDCNGQALAYWATNTPYSFVKLQSVYAATNHLAATASINGRRMTVWFDTGSPRSFLTLAAAARAGITPDSPGVTFLGTGSGIGGAAEKMWVAPVDSFQLGGEKVEHAHLLVADYHTTESSPDMLLGEDFFLSHRIYVAYSQSKLYFTYNGGPLFNLDLPEVLSGKELLQSQPDADAAATAADIRSDLDAVSRLAAPAAAVRLTLGSLYGRLGDYSAAVGQIDEWLDNHPLESDQAIGLNSRCRLRATVNRELSQALDDCDHALDLTQGQNDLAAAEKLDRGIAKRFAAMGLTP